MSVLSNRINTLAILLLMTGTVYAADPIGGIIEQSGVQGSIVRLTGEEIDAKIEEEIVSYDEIDSTKDRLKIEVIEDTPVSLKQQT